MGGGLLSPLSQLGVSCPGDTDACERPGRCCAGCGPLHSVHRGSDRREARPGHPCPSLPLAQPDTTLSRPGAALRHKAALSSSLSPPTPRSLRMPLAYLAASSHKSLQCLWGFFPPEGLRILELLYSLWKVPPNTCWPLWCLLLRRTRWKVMSATSSTREKTRFCSFMALLPSDQYLWCHYSTLEQP